MHRYEGLEFDRYVAKYYTNKVHGSKERGIDFDLSLTEVKALLRTKKCQLTGIDMSHTGANTADKVVQRPSDVTIDRIDASLPYVKSNCIAVSYMANQLKAGFERSCGKLAIPTLHKMSKVLLKKGYK